MLSGWALTLLLVCCSSAPRPLVVGGAHTESDNCSLPRLHTCATGWGPLDSRDYSPGITMLFAASTRQCELLIAWCQSTGMHGRSRRQLPQQPYRGSRGDERRVLIVAINEHRSRALGPRDRRSASQQFHHAGRAWAVDNTRDEDAALNLLHAAERAVAGSSSANVAHTRGSGEGHILRRPMRRGLFAEPRAGPAAPTARRCAAHGCGDSEKFVTHMCGYACPMW